MKKITLRINAWLLAAVSVLSTATLSADRHCSTNDLLPIGRLIITPEIGQGKAAFGLLGEAGQNNARASVTLGTNIGDCKRLKIGGEYLSQKMRYHYKTGHSQRWRQQWAVGGQYESTISYCWIDTLNIAADASYAKGRLLSGKNFGDGLSYRRRIAGSKTVTGQAGLTLLPWDGGKLTLLCDYDNFRYERSYQSLKRLSGFGWTAILRQKLFGCFDLYLMAENRRPYNNYTGILKWGKRSCVGPLTIGFFGGYLQGKAHLGNATTAGIELGWAFGLGTDTICCNGKSSTLWYDKEPIGTVTEWVQEPAVYLPVTFLIPDHKIVFPEGS